MTRIRFLVSNPAGLHVGTGSSDWLVLGTRPERVGREVDDATSFDSLVETVRSFQGEYTVASLGSNGKRTVRAYRGIASSYDLYYARRPQDGAIVVGDHFGNVLSELPVSARTIHPSVPADQLLLGTRPTEPYVEAVSWLGHGERLDWTPGDAPETTFTGRLSPDGPISPDAAKRRLDRRLREVTRGDQYQEPVATMLSGGVDSTLLHTYRDAGPTVSAGYDSPEFEFEIEYAREASDLLGSAHELLLYEEGDYLSHLEAAVDAAGLPLLLPQGTLIHLAVSESPYRTYLNGGLADGLFGTGTAALAYLARFLGPLGRYVPDLNTAVAELTGTAERIRRPATDPEGAAMNFRIHSDVDRVAGLVGRETVDERRRERLRYTRRRVDVDDGAGYTAHVHLGHAIEYFHDNILTIWRHAAHAAGKSIITPFGGREVLETALAVPPADRYARFALPPRDHPLRVVQYKYLLKELLGERLPGYDTRQPKGHGLVPYWRYLEDGPLSGVFERYPVPEFVPEGERESIRNGTDFVTWFAASYAVWRDRVLENGDLERQGSTTVIDR